MDGLLPGESAPRSPSSTFKLSARIARWLLVGMIVLFAVLCAIGVGIIVNRAPFNQLVSVWINFTIVYAVLFAVLILATIVYYPSGTVEENAAQSRDPSNQPGDDKISHAKFRFSRKEFVMVAFSFTTVLICVIITMAFIFPEAFNNTSGLRFQKLGSVNATSARVMLRDGSERTNLTHVLYYRETSVSAWTSIAFDLDETRDYTKYVSISGLLPLTTYTYAFDHVDAGKLYNFTTAPLVGTPNTFSFYFGSCFFNNVPNFMQSSGWRNVDVLLSARQVTKSFILFIRDFIYSDHPWMKGESVDTFSSLYRQVFTNPHIERTVSRFPSYYMFDDHELVNNWDSQTTGLYANAMRAWNSFLGLGNPPLTGVTQEESDAVEYFDFMYGDVAFFHLDTRSYRSPNTMQDSASKTMLGATQKQRFFAWLLEKNTTAVFKFIVSSVGWTSKLNKNADGWGKGFFTERQEIFTFIRENRITGCVFLSADSHFVYSRVELDHSGSGLLEFSSSPLSAFATGSGGFSGSESLWEETGNNETVKWYSVGNGPFVSLLGVIDVDTLSAVPQFKISYYDGAETLLHEDTVTMNDLKPE